MNLYELQTSWTGESYVRAYAWAENPADAERLFREKHRGTKYEDTVANIVLLMPHDAKPFCTEANDHGWETERK